MPKLKGKDQKMSEDHLPLLIIDVFNSQTTEAVLKVLSNYNMNLFQSLEIPGGANGNAKKIMKGKYMLTYAMNAGQELDFTDIKLNLSIIIRYMRNG